MDSHSLARPAEARVTSLALDLRADFDARRLIGRAALTLDCGPDAHAVVLDTRDLEISGVAALSPQPVAAAPLRPSDVAARLTDGARPLAYSLGPPDSVLGRPLEVALPPGVRQIVIDYATSPDAAALQWLAPEQTAGRRHPFLFSQGQAILTRTWIPTQDSPGIRQTFYARIVVPRGLRALMSAESLTPDGIDIAEGRSFEFQLTTPVPPYLIALAIGDLAFRSLGARSGVYAEPATIEAAAFEFGDLEKMLAAAESLLGPYRWGRYDVLVLPPSFPFGGMENPLLTFATPTILAGDRSLVSLIAHELAHSWSGNLVTNATWRDFWLNEGVTTYVEQRIMEALYGVEYAAMVSVLSRRELLQEIDRLGGPSSLETILHIDLSGRDPDEGATRIPYDKGAALMTLIENTVGRERFDAFLRSYFDRYAFQSIVTSTFVEYLRQQLFPSNDGVVAALRLDEWIFEPGLPDNALVPRSDRLDRVAGHASAFVSKSAAITTQPLGRTEAGHYSHEGAREGGDAALVTAHWTTQEWLHFLGCLPDRLVHTQLTELDATFGFTDRGNSEVLFAWLRIAIRNRYQPSLPALERFLTTQGRRKFLRPLYEDLMATDWGQDEARRIYASARPTYHSVATATLDAIVG